MAKFGRRIRFRGTSMEGYITKQLIHNGERVYKVIWDRDDHEDPRPYTSNDLEPLQREDRQNLQIIKQADCPDRKVWEDFQVEHGTVESRQHFRSGDGWERI